MGSTHYFPHTKVSPRTWDKILADCLKLGQFISVPLADGLGQPCTLPEFTAEQIKFNGVGPDHDHETFWLHRKGTHPDAFRFCETARKPYDLMVTACLLTYHYHSPGTIELSSDGTWGEWQPARSLIKLCLGRVQLRPPGIDDEV